MAASCALLLAACGGYDLNAPAVLDDGWRVAQPEDVGLDARVIGDLMEHITSTPERAVHGVLIVKDGRLVVEEYFDGYRFDYDDPEFRGEPVAYNATTRHNIMSVTKAFTAAVVGIAVANGDIPSVDIPVLEALPEYAEAASPGAEDITIEHLLTMTSGLDWNEWDVPITDTARNDLIQLFIVDDPIEYVLSKPVAHEPGSWWYYSGGDVNVLGEVVGAFVGMPIDEYAEGALFAPLGITDVVWPHLTPDVVYTSGELELTPRELAKFGYLFVNDGVWDGVQVLSAEWVDATLTDRASTRGTAADGEGYGYQWFVPSFVTDSGPVEAYVRTGWGGQVLAVFPDLEMVVVLTGGDYVLRTQATELITDYVLPAVEGDGG